MSGKRYLLDTNALVQLLSGNREIAGIVREADFLATSVICKFEFLSFPGLADADAELFSLFAARVKIFPVPEDDESFTRAVVSFRRTERKNLKMPDAIIAATASTSGCAVLTADADFKGVPGLDVRSYEPV